MRAAPTRALQGIRVLELANFIAGPFIGMLLADYGAAVTKIEHPDGGDGLRNWGERKNDVGLYHKVLNRNKRSVTADLRTPLGKEIVLRMAAQADVVIENFRPGTLEKWGLGYDQLSASNPGLVLVRITGFGQTGPMHERSGFGSLAEAMTGFAYTNGFPDRPPLLPSFALSDTTTGLAGAFLTMAAIQARHTNGGLGQVVDLAIYEPVLTLLGPHVIEYDQVGIVQERAGSRLPLVSPRNTFRTRDGKWIAISAGAPAVFARLCQALDAPHIASDPRFATNQSRRTYGDEIEAALQEAVGRFDCNELVTRMDQFDAPGAPVYSVADVMQDAHFKARENLTQVHDQELNTTLTMQNVMGKLSNTPGHIDAAGPPLGAHNKAVLVDELGFEPQTLMQAGLRL